MNIRSKISRSLVVVIFALFIIFLSFLDLRMLVGNSTVGSDYSNTIKIGYAVLVVALLLIYVYIKDKLYKKKVKRSIGIVYRYIYISIILVAAKMFTINYDNINMSMSYNIIYVIISCVTAIIIRKIIFNVSKSDILSVLGTFAYIFIPIGKCYYDKLIVSSIYSLALFAAIFVLQILIDELKQPGIKTVKYVIESAVLGLIIGITIALGVNQFVWIIFALVSVLVASSLDSTHISFPKKVMTNITQKNRESLYKIERININKIFVSIVISTIVAFLVCLIFRFVLVNFIGDKGYYLSIIDQNLNLSEKIEMLKTINIHGIKDFYINLVSHMKTFYLFLNCYIIFMEILAVVLRRKYDTKSTMMKAMFLLLLNSIYVFNMDLSFYDNIISGLLILIAIVNTSNIYLNREERIKMLVA